MNEHRCAACGGRYEHRLVTVELRNPQGQLIIIRHVPAEVCIQCGDELFDPDTTHCLLELAQNPPAPVTTLKVPVYDLSAT